MQVHSVKAAVLPHPPRASHRRAPTFPLSRQDVRQLVAEMLD
jgi:hypothetical protein